MKTTSFFTGIFLCASLQGAAPLSSNHPYEIRGELSTLNPTYQPGVIELNKTITHFAETDPADVIVNGNATHKKVALTFDDGPGGTTSAILDILKAEGVHATFFLRGEFFAENEAEIKRIRDEGHAVFSHTWTHPDLTKKTDTEIEAELRRAHETLEKILGKEISPRFVRLSFGKINDTVLAVLKRLKLTAIMWSLETFDWTSSRTTEQVASTITSELRPGEIILMHNLKQSTATVKALPGMIRQIKEMGFGFARVDDVEFITHS